MSEAQLLPNGDLWRAPVMEEREVTGEDGETYTDYVIIPRKDNVDMSKLPPAPKMNPDTIAAMYDRMTRAEAALAAQK